MALGLTPHEFTLLRLLFLRRGSVVDKGVLMEQLYPDGREPELKAVEVMVCRLRKKLQAAGAAWLIGTVWGTGYRLGEPPAPLPAALPAVPPLPVNAPAPFA
jgi:two-component system cell cycle response regulator CtrA